MELLTDATDDTITRSLNTYSDELLPDDILFIRYPERGGATDVPPDRAYLLGVDVGPEMGTGLLLAEHVSEKIKSIDAKRVFVVTDSCFSTPRLRKNSLQRTAESRAHRGRLLLCSNASADYGIRRPARR